MSDGSASKRFDLFSPGVGMLALGAGLISMSLIEGARMLSARPGASVLDAAPVEERTSFTPSIPSLGALMPADASDADPLDAQDAVGVGRGAPQATGSGPRGALIGITAAPMPNGLAIFRMYASGAVEAMITTEDNRWGAWVPVAPGLSTDMRRPAAGDGSGNPDTENDP